MTRLLSLVTIAFLVLQPLCAWGLRSHTVANLAAAEEIPQDGPVFLRVQEAYIGHLGTIPDTWRSFTEPYLRISEDANHGWYTEGFDFIPNPPPSRTEFILRVYDEYLRIKGSDPERAKPLNIRYTGLQAYSIIEGYERMKAGMRLYRAVDDPKQTAPTIAASYAPISPVLRDPAQIKQMLANDIAFYMGWVGHYVADAAQPLHNSIHHDGWSGNNPKGYTRDPNIHGRFETRYVDLIEVTSADVVKYMRKEPRHLEDVWKATLDHSPKPATQWKISTGWICAAVFRRRTIRKRASWFTSDWPRERVFCSDLAYTEWTESAKAVPRIDPINQIQNPADPKYNPAAGSAPAP